jgi:hypothetical protein
MNLTDYLSRRLKKAPRRDSKGKQSEWLEFCDIVLHGPKFLIVDANFVPSEEDGILVEVSPGTYHVQVKGMEYGRDKRVSRLRAVLVGAGGVPVLGQQLGETWTDTALTGICDFEVFKKAWGNDEATSHKRIGQAIEEADSFGIAELDRTAGAIMVFVSSGFGDGTFPVLELRENGRRAGFEIQFIAEDEPYPFGDYTTPRGSADDKSATRPTSLSDMVKAFTGLFKTQAQSATAGFREHLSEVRSKAAPLRLRLIPIPEPAWTNTPSAVERIQALRQAGFVDAGAFCAEQNNKIQLAGYVNVEKCIDATLLKVGEKLFLSLASRYADGDGIEFTEMPLAAELPLPKWLMKSRHPDKSADQLIECFLAERPKKELLPATSEAFSKSAEQDYFRYQAWFAERGGATLEELRARLQAAGKLPSGPSGLDLLKITRSEEAEKALCNWLRLQADLPFHLDEVLDGLVIVHDELPPDLLANAYWCATNDFEVQEQDFAGACPRLAFARLVAERGTKLRKVHEKSSPLAADFYLPA